MSNNNINEDKGRDVHVEVEDRKHILATVVPDIELELSAIGGVPNPWGRGHIQLYAMCMVIYLCSTMNGMLEFYWPSWRAIGN
jgi:hypothetical protein